MANLREQMVTKFRYGPAYRKLVERRAAQDAMAWTLIDERRRSFYSRFFGHGDLVFDVGANWGNRCKIFLAMGAKVVAVEPQPDLADVLRRNYRRLSNIHIVDAAVAAEAGSIELFIGDADALTTTNKEWMKSVQASGRFSDRRWDRSITVETLTLDQLIDKWGEPRFIKIDIEGGELAALHGLSHPVHSVSFEYTPERLDDAEACLHHLEGLGLSHFNLSMGEAMQLEQRDWFDGKGIRELLKRYSEKANRDLFGDVYALRDL